MRKDLTWPVPDEPVTMEFVIKTGWNMDVKFPEDYISCAAKNNGSAVMPYVFNVEGERRVFGTLLSYDTASNDYIVNVYNNYLKTLPKKLVPFGFDPAGNLICFDYRNHEENPIVVFWEHEDAWEKEELMKSEGITAEQAEEVARENVFYIADTFTDFLDKLHE